MIPIRLLKQKGQQTQKEGFLKKSLLLYYMLPYWNLVQNLMIFKFFLSEV